MFVNVQYYRSGVYAGNYYAYETDLDLREGDKVIAPTKNEPRQRAIVKEINAPAPRFLCKKIEEYDPEGEVVIL